MSLLLLLSVDPPNHSGINLTNPPDLKSGPNWCYSEENPKLRFVSINTVNPRTTIEGNYDQIYQVLLSFVKPVGLGTIDAFTTGDTHHETIYVLVGHFSRV